MATGKVTTYAIVSVWADGQGGQTAVASGVELLRGGLESWGRHGVPELSTIANPSLRDMRGR